MRNAGIEEIEAGIKIAGRNISNLRYADDATLRAENEMDLEILLTKVKEEVQRLTCCLIYKRRKLCQLTVSTEYK